MKVLTIIVRILIGLLLIFGSVVYFLKLYPVPEMKGDLKTFNEGLDASHYLMSFVKGVELLCGLSFLTGKFVKLTAIMLLPITINIFLVHIFVDTGGIAVGIIILLANIFIIYRNWDSYKHLFTP